MTDDLDELKADWQRQQIDIERLRQRQGRARAWIRFVLVSEVALTLVAIAVGAVYAWFAWRWHDLLFAVAALVMLLVPPPFALYALRLRRRSLDWADRTPEGTLRYTLQRLQLTARTVRLGYWGGWLLLAITVVYWVIALMGWTSPRYPPGFLRLFLGFISAVWIVSAIGAFTWSTWRLRQINAEHASCERLLETFMQAARNGSPAS